jgi:hypothetical protein
MGIRQLLLPDFSPPVQKHLSVIAQPLLCLHSLSPPSSRTFHISDDLNTPCAQVWIFLVLPYTFLSLPTSGAFLPRRQFYGNGQVRKFFGGDSVRVRPIGLHCDLRNDEDFAEGDIEPAQEIG